MEYARSNNIVLVVGVAFLLAAPLWMWFVAPTLQKLPADFSYTADIISIDNLYNEELRQYSGEIQSNTTFSYEVEGESEGALLIKNVFDVRKPSGEKIFAVERHYGVDPESGAHVEGTGDTSRDGYLFAPKHLKKGDPFTYWHINYDGPAHMRFVGEENLLGLPVFRYETHYEDVRIDQTENLKFLPGVGVARGIELDPYLQLWIEPSSGRMVKYEDKTVAYYYDLKTGERLNPWNQFGNSYTFASVADQVRAAAKEKQKAFLVETLVPSVLGLVGIVFLLLYFFKKRGVSLFKDALLLPTLLAILSLLATYGGWQYVTRSVENTSRVQFEAQASEIENAIENRLHVYINALLAARGLYAASNEVERGEWSDFVRGINLEQNYPGIRALSFNAYVRPHEIDAFEKLVRGDTGLSDFAIRPTGEREAYVPITFIEPIEKNKEALGFDVFSEPIRRVALEEARDTGEIVMTGKVELAQAQGGRGFLFVAPVYINGESTATEIERRRAIKGYVAAVVETENFLRRVLGTRASSIAVEVFDTYGEAITDANRLYQSHDTSSVLDASSVPKFRTDKIVEFGGREWTVVYTSLPGFEQNFARVYVPLLVALGGVIFSVLLFGIVYSLASARTRAVSIAEGMTRELREGKAKDEAMLLSIGDGLIATDSEGRIALTNQAFERLLGWSEAEVRGRKLTEIAPMLDEQGKELHESESMIWKALQQKTTTTTTTTTLQFKRKDGSVFPVAVTVSPIILEGAVVGAVEVFRDITHEKEIDKAKTEFVSLASHQLRTPLSTVNWYTEMLLAGDAGKVSDEQKKYLDEIYAGNQRMVGLVNALLNVSRLELGTFTIEPEPTDVALLMRSVIEEQKPQSDARKQSVRAELSSDIPTIPADPKLLRMVFQNLLSNAIKYTPEGGDVSVTITRKGDEIMCTVSDTGMGIPKSEQDKLFSKLFRATNARESDTDGTGLGLYIVKAVVEQSGGSIRFESAEDKGTTFYVSLPVGGMRKKEGEKGFA